MLVEKRASETISKGREGGRPLFDFKVTLMLLSGWDGKRVNGEGIEESSGKY